MEINIHINHEYFTWLTKLLKSCSLIRKNIFENFNKKRTRG